MPLSTRERDLIRMDAGTMVALISACGAVSFAIALEIVSIVALWGAPPDKRAEIIHALAALFRRASLPESQRREFQKGRRQVPEY